MKSSELIELARLAAENSYSPYSEFPVGAVLLTKEGKLYSGCNVENASSGLTTCAERVAIFSAIAAGERDFTTIAVSCLNGDSAAPNTLMPCGACLQIMAEFFTTHTIVIVDGVGDFQFVELFPHPFKLPSK